MPERSWYPYASPEFKQEVEDGLWDWWFWGEFEGQLAWLSGEWMAPPEPKEDGFGPGVRVAVFCPEREL